MSGKKIFNFLPFWGKFIGGFLMALGLISSYYFIYLSIKPEFLQLNVFTIYAKFIETTTVSFIRNNQGDELSVLSYLFGFLLFMFADGKVSPEKNFERKAKALISAFLLVVIVLIVTTLLIHGSPVLIIWFLLLYLIPLLFVIFYFSLKKH